MIAEVIFLNRSLVIFRETGDEEYQVLSLLRIADLNMRQGRLDQASDQWQPALLIASKLNNKREMAFSLGGM